MGVIKKFFENVISKFVKPDIEENAVVKEYQKYLETSSNSHDISEVLKDSESNITTVIPTEKGPLSIMKRSIPNDFAEYKHYKGVVSVPVDGNDKNVFVDLEHVYRPSLCHDGVGILGEIERVDGNLFEIDSGKVSNISYAKEGNDIKLDCKMEDAQTAFDAIDYINRMQKVSVEACFENAFKDIFEVDQNMN